MRSLIWQLPDNVPTLSVSSGVSVENQHALMTSQRKQNKNLVAGVYILSTLAQQFDFRFFFFQSTIGVPSRYIVDCCDIFGNLSWFIYFY